MKTAAQIVKEFRTGHALAIEACRRHYGRRRFIAPREVEVMACDGKGERLTNEPIEIPLSKLNAKSLSAAMASLQRRRPDATHIAVEIGYDLWDSFYEYMKRDDGYDYDPRVDHHCLELPCSEIAS